MNEKKQEHEILEKKHHFEIWESDLAEFLVVLEKLET